MHIVCENLKIVLISWEFLNIDQLSLLFEMPLSRKNQNFFGIQCKLFFLQNLANFRLVRTTRAFKNKFI